MPEIVEFSKSIVRVEGPAGARRTWVDGLENALKECYDQFQLPSETGVAWATPGREVSVAAMSAEAADRKTQD
jgi:hypothetical protein